MQVTLASHYGPKPAGLAALIRACQDQLHQALGDSFRPYRLEQVHATIVGLEGCRMGEKILNRNSQALGAPACMNLDGLLTYLRSNGARFDIRIGGFGSSTNYSFESRGEHPHLRSFSIQGAAAVAMGWPIADSGLPNVLDDFRWHVWREFGVRHKWHPHDESHDNDFYFVLGRLCGDVDAVRVTRAIQVVRALLSADAGLVFAVSRDSLQVVAYTDETLPLETSVGRPVMDESLTAERMATWYPPCSLVAR
jgi:hypothetical protein